MKRWIRWPLRVVAGAGVLLALALAFLFFSLHHLDAAWLKPRVQRWLSVVSGFEVGWRSIRVDLGAGIHLEGLEIKSPPAFRDRAPDLLTADVVEVDGSVLTGFRAARITNGGLTLVREGNRGSWEAKPAAAPKPGLSQVLADLFSKPPPIHSVSLEGGSITWIDVDPAGQVTRVRVSGLKANAQGWVVTLGTAATPVPVDLEYERGESKHQARLNVQGSSNAKPGSLVADVDMAVLQQDWAPNFSLEKLLRLHLTVQFDAAHQRIDLDLDHVNLLDETVTLKGAVVLPDDPAAFPMAHDLDGAVDLERLASFLAPLKLPVSLDRDTLRFRAKNTDAIDIEANTGRVVVARTGATISLSSATLTTTLRPHGPHFVRAKLNGHCIAGAAGATPWFDEDVRVDLQVEDLATDFSRAHVRGTMAGPWGELAVDEQHHIHDEAAHITFRLPSLALLRPFLPQTLNAVDWGRASAEGKIDVRAHLGSERPKIRQTSEITLQNLTARLPAGRLAVHSASVNLRSEGTDREHHAELGLRLAGMQWQGSPPSDQALDTTLNISVAPPRFHLALKTDGALVPSMSADLQAHFDRSRRELVSKLTAKASRMSRLAVLLKDVPGAARLDLAKLEATLSGRAHLQGVVSGVDGNGVPRFEPQLLERARGDAELQGTMGGVRWAGREQAAAISSARFEATAKGDRRQATVEGHLDILGAKYSRNEDSYGATPISLRFSAAVKPRSGEADGQGELEVGQVSLREGFGYPLDGLKLSISLERQPDGVIHVRKATLENAAGGTTLDLHAGLALQEIPGKLSAQGSLTQDLSKVWKNADDFSGEGRAELRFAVESSDLRVFHTSGTLSLERVGLRVPSYGLIAEGVDSEIPLLLGFERKPTGIALIQRRRLNAYSALRFVDQHPLFRRRSYLSIRRLVTPQLTLESFAGNLKVDHSLIALEQMETSVRGGHLAGRCLVDANPKNLRAQLELRATGILSSGGEPFDGNAALSVSLRDRSVDGRAEILRIGKRHLLDLLDLQDPQHVQPAFNRVRRALAFGYPDQVKITFDRGFANVHIAFGGLASLLRVDDLRGIPMEPLIDKYVKEEP